MLKSIHKNNVIYIKKIFFKEVNENNNTNLFQCKTIRSSQIAVGRKKAFIVYVYYQVTMIILFKHWVRRKHGLFLIL